MCNCWGATPDSPFSSLLSQAVSAGGYVKVRILTDLSSVRAIRLVP